MAEYIDKHDPTGCLSRALPGEPMLILLGRDACAPAAIRFWADARAKRAIEDEVDQDAQQIADALDTADEMETWRRENDGEWRKAPIRTLTWSNDAELAEAISVAIDDQMDRGSRMLTAVDVVTLLTKMSERVA